MSYCPKSHRVLSLGLMAATGLFACLFQSTAQAAPQHGKEKGSMEVFDEIDPYTKGEKELMDKLGYVRFGPFKWTKGHPTNELEEMLGGTPMIWVETEHFKIGSSLTTYKLPPDVEQKAQVKADIKRLKERIGRLKMAKRNRLDPWLRLHLYAQRAEDLYAKFMTDFGLTEADFEEGKPYLGNPNKFLLLLCERKSELSRYTRGVHGQPQEAVFRYGAFNDCMVLGASLEAIRENFGARDDAPYDTVLYCQIVSSLITNFINGFQGNLYEAPDWLGNVLAHYYVRQLDPRYMTARGYGPNDPPDADSWKWIPVIQQLVKTKYVTATTKMFAWEKYADMTKHDHMTAWSKLEYLLTEVKGDRKCWIEAMCNRGSEEGKKEELVARQTRALLACMELTPEELDTAWAKWVKKTYKRRK